VSGPGPEGAGAAAGGQAGEAGARVGRNALFLILGQVVTTAVAIVYSAALGRRLGTEDYGVYFLITTMALFSFVVVEWGGGLFVIREVARRPARAGLLLGSALVLRAAGSLVIMLPTAGVAWAFGYSPRVAWLALAAIAAALPVSLAQAFGMIFRASDRMGRDASVSVLNKVATVALALPALWLGLGLPGVLAAQGLAGLGAVAAAAWLYRRMGGARLAASLPGAREVVAGSAPLLALAVTNSVQPYIDVLVLSKLASAAAVGWFGAARNVLGTLLAPAAILASATYPTLSRAAEVPGQLRVALRQSLRPALWLGALGATGTYLFGELAIAIIFGESGFAPSGVVLQAYAPGLFLMFVDVQLGHAAVAVGRERRFAALKAATIVLSTGLCLVLIPYFEARSGNGGVGVVLAFVASELVVFGGAVLLLPRAALDPALAGDTVRAVAAALLTLGLFRLLPPLSPVLGIPLCVVAFAGISLGVGLVRRADLPVLLAILGRRRPGVAPGEPGGG
jgi:PST family polysaccharide transporter